MSRQEPWQAQLRGSAVGSVFPDLVLPLEREQVTDCGRPACVALYAAQDCDAGVMTEGKHPQTRVGGTNTFHQGLILQPPPPRRLCLPTL